MKGYLLVISALLLSSCGKASPLAQLPEGSCSQSQQLLAKDHISGQIDAIADSVDKEVWESGKIHVHAVEGKANREWILMDYYDVIVHVFLKDKRAFFKLEELWGDAKFTVIPD